MPKTFIIHIRFGDVLYARILAECERLGMSQTDTVRYLLTKYFEAQDAAKSNQGGGA